MKDYKTNKRIRPDIAAHREKLAAEMPEARKLVRGLPGAPTSAAGVEREARRFAAAMAGPLVPVEARKPAMTAKHVTRALAWADKNAAAMDAHRRTKTRRQVKRERRAAKLRGYAVADEAQQLPRVPR